MDECRKAGDLLGCVEGEVEAERSLSEYMWTKESLVIYLASQEHT
jgi:hypothetical protein